MPCFTRTLTKFGNRCLPFLRACLRHVGLRRHLWFCASPPSPSLATPFVTVSGPVSRRLVSGPVRRRHVWHYASSPPTRLGSVCWSRAPISGPVHRRTACRASSPSLVLCVIAVSLRGHARRDRLWSLAAWPPSLAACIVVTSGPMRRGWPRASVPSLGPVHPSLTPCIVATACRASSPSLLLRVVAISVLDHTRRDRLRSLASSPLSLAPCIVVMSGPLHRFHLCSLCVVSVSGLAPRALSASLVVCGGTVSGRALRHHLWS